MSQIFWRQRADARTHCPCLFLDRDGVVVEEVGYLHRAEDVRLLPGAAEVIAAARDRGWAVGLVTNQAGVGRGYYDWTAFAAVQTVIAEHLGLGEEPFDFVAACGTHPEAAHDHLRIADHPWRKPNPGMLQMAAAALSLDMPASIMVGDQLTDLQAGLAAGVGRVVHVLTGHGAEARAGVERLAVAIGGRRLLSIQGLDTLESVLGESAAWSGDQPASSSAFASADTPVL